MQNVMVWIINKDFDGYKWRYKEDQERILNYLKLQVENSLHFGWKIEDIVLITNFDFEYMGVKAYQTGLDVCKWSAFANKLTSVNEMIKRGVITQDFWFHDVDAYQLIPFEFPAHCKDWGYTKHDPRRSKPQGGSGFYRKTSFDIIDTISKLIIINKVSKEESFLPSFMWEKGVARTHKLESLINNSKLKNHQNYEVWVKEYEIGKNAYGVYSDRFTLLNYEWNMSIVHHFVRKYKEAEKPIKIAHFHPEYPGCKTCFLQGKNVYNAVIATDYLKDLLLKYNLVPTREG